MLTHGSLFSGVLGLDLGLERAGFAPAWYCENDPWKQTIIRAHRPGVPIYPDVSTLADLLSEGPEGARPGRLRTVGGGSPSGDARDARPRPAGLDADSAGVDGLRRVQPDRHRPGESVDHRGRAVATDLRGSAGLGADQPDDRLADRRGDRDDPGRVPLRRPRSVDLITGGFPCQDVSVAGKRAGLAGSRTGLFWTALRVIDALRPRAILLENVPGLLSSNGGRDFGVILGELADLGYGVAWRILDAQHFGVPQRRRRVFLLALAGERLGAERAGTLLHQPESSPWNPTPRLPPRPDLAGSVESGARAESGGVTAGTLRSHPRPGSNSDGAITLAPTLKASTGKGGNYGHEMPLTVGTLGGTSPGGGWRVGADEAAAGHLTIAKSLTSEGHDASEDGTGRANLILDDDATSRAYSIIPESGQGADLTASEIDTAPAISAVTYGRSTDRGVRLAGETSVRRLTPLECERLMGWPDSWTAPPGINAPDSRRYAACGDGVVSAVTEWIGHRLAAHLEEDA